MYLCNLFQFICSNFHNKTLDERYHGLMFVVTIFDMVECRQAKTKFMKRPESQRYTTESCHFPTVSYKHTRRGEVLFSFVKFVCI